MAQGQRDAATINAKVDAIHRIRASIDALDETFRQLGKLRLKAEPADRGDIAAEMANVNEEETAESLFLNHLQASTTEVKPPPDDSFKELDKALGELEELKRQTNDVAKALRIASAIVDAASRNRVEVSSRTT